MKGLQAGKFLVERLAALFAACIICNKVDGKRLSGIDIASVKRMGGKYR